MRFSDKIENSKKVVFISECLINQNIRAYGVKNVSGTGPVTEILNELIRNQIGFTVVSCPEVEYEGLRRRTCGKIRYDNPTYRTVCTKIAENVIKRLKMYLNDGYRVGGLICVNGSPSCGIDFCAIGGGEGWSNEPGVFIEELEKKLKENNLSLDYVGAEMYKMPKTIAKIRQMIYSVR
jgi:predicted secreted protein